MLAGEEITEKQPNINTVQRCRTNDNTNITHGNPIPAEQSSDTGNETQGLERPSRDRVTYLLMEVSLMEVSSLMELYLMELI